MSRSERTDQASTDVGPAPGGYLGGGSGEAPRVGDTVDRYTLVAPLGEGAMGVVFRATDGDLRRDVALKLLRSAGRGGGDGDGDGAARARLLDEARAMARLHHPGVVAVYDVGTAAGRDFVAMELIAGTTLASWMKQARPWREVVTRFVAAGRGLAAAHAAGVVHRDFKPHNVLCGDNGRVAVADFGLARIEEVEGGAAGGIAGTPAYMAPEQLDGGVATAASDQFGFCVALFEGVYGRRPFAPRPDGAGGAPRRAPASAGDAIAREASAVDWLARQREAIAAGPVLPPDPPRIPARLRRALWRGLAVEPSARHRDLPALLRELEAVLAAPRRRAIAAAAIVLLGAGTATMVTLGGAPPSQRPACEATRFAPVWPGPARDRLSAALAAAPDVQRSVLRGLDGYAARWDARWGALCEHEAEDTPAFHAVAGCLLDGRDQAAALIDELPRLDPAALAAAVTAVERLPEPGACAAARAAALPDDAALRTRVRAIEAELARLRGTAAAPLAERRATAARLVDDARATGFRPLVAAALVAQAVLDEHAGDLALARTHLHEAALVAEEAGVTEVRVEALVMLAEIEAEYSSDAVAQARATRQAAAAIDGSLAPPRLRARLREAQARIAMLAGDHAAALAFVDEAIAIHDADGVRLSAATTRVQRVRILRAAGDHAASLAEAEGALTAAVAAAGPTCGVCEPLRYEAAFALHALGRHAEAQARVDDALRHTPHDPPPPGPRLLRGRVVDRARRPLAGVTVLALEGDLRGDPEFLIQPADRLPALTGAWRTVTAADGTFELHGAPGSMLVLAEHASGRALPRRVHPGPGPETLALTIEPWAYVEGDIASTSPDAHVHLTPIQPDGKMLPPAPGAPVPPGYRIEVPVVDGHWRARVPALPHDVRLVRSDARYEAVLATAEVRPRAGEHTTVAMQQPGDVEVTVHVRADRAIELDNAGVLLFSGHDVGGALDGQALMDRFLADRGNARALMSVPDGEGGSRITLTEVTPGPYTLCAAALPGDMNDPQVRTRVMANLASIDGVCRKVDIAPAPAQQDITLEVPPPRRLPAPTPERAPAP